MAPAWPQFDPPFAPGTTVVASPSSCQPKPPAWAPSPLPPPSLPSPMPIPVSPFPTGRQLLPGAGVPLPLPPGALPTHCPPSPSQLAGNYYPERLGHFFLISPPTAFSALWKGVYRFIDPVTREKVGYCKKEWRLGRGGWWRWVASGRGHACVACASGGRAAGGPGCPHLPPPLPPPLLLEPLQQLRRQQSSMPFCP